MDFFRDFNDQPTTPVYSKFHPPSSEHRSTKNVKFATETRKLPNDDFDDLLDNLISKEDLRKSRKNIQSKSSQMIDGFVKTVQKFPTSHNLQSDHNNVMGNFNSYNTNAFLSRDGNKASKRSFMDDLVSEDNRSQKSGGRRAPVESAGLISFKKQDEQQTPLVYGSVRGGMRPPLKKRAESRDGSIVDGKGLGMGSLEDLQMEGLMRGGRREKQMDMVKEEGKIIVSNKNEQGGVRSQSLFKQFQPMDNNNKPQFQGTLPMNPLPTIPSSSLPNFQPPIVNQKTVEKIIHIPQPPLQLKKRYQEQLLAIKKSYQNQMEVMRGSYEKMVEEEREGRMKVVKLMEETMEGERGKWETRVKEEVERVKSMYEWEMKRKQDGYEMEIRRLKQLLDTVTASRIQTQSNTNNTRSPNVSQLTHQQLFQIQAKQKQLQSQRQSLQQLKLILQTKRRQLQSQQHQFQMYRRREEQRVSEERRKVLEHQGEVKKREIQIKREMLYEKQAIAASLAEGEINLQQQRESLKHQMDKLSMQKQLFNQQKAQYQRINQKVLNDLKDKKKQVQKQKQTVAELELQLYKKINLMEMVAVEKKVNDSNNCTQVNVTAGRNNRSMSTTMHRGDVYNKENARGRVNSQLDDKILETKTRYQQMEKMLTNQRVDIKKGLVVGSDKIHLEKYIEKLAKNKLTRR